MSVRTEVLPKQFHDAVVRWRETYLPDYDFLMENWEKHFPNEPRFELCAFRELGMCTEIECGDQKGKPKFTRAADMHPEQAHHLFGAIRAQASTEFGSIQQHRLTLARAQDEEEQFWILRMMAEELRHGYQMLHLLVEDDWTSVSKESSADMRGGHPVDEHRLPPAGRLQHRLRLVRRQRGVLRPDRPRGQVPARHAEGERLPADGGEHAADAARGGLPPRRRRGADAALGDRRGEGRGLRHHRRAAAAPSTSGCRAASRCSATSAAAAPTCAGA